MTTIPVDHHPSAVIVEFRTPRPQRIFNVVFALSMLAAGTFIGGVFLFLLTHRLFPRTWHPWTVTSICAAAALVMVVVVLGLTRHGPTRLAMNAHGIAARGLFYRRWMSYADITLVDARKRSRTVGHVCRLSVRTRNGEATTIWLSDADADEFMTVLRGLCEHVSAITLSEELILPADDTHVRSGLLAASLEFRRRARRSLLVAVVFTILCVSSISSLVLHYQGVGSSRSLTRKWVGAAAISLVVVSSLTAWAVNRRRALRLRAEADDMREDDDLAEDE